MHNYKSSAVQWHHNCLKITLLHGVSIITKFVIPKHDKKQTKNITLCRLQPSATHDPHYNWHGDSRGLYHFYIP